MSTSDLSTSARQGRLHGRSAFVTGGGSGIGAATVTRLVSEGARVVAVDRDADALERLYGEVDAVSTIAHDLALPLGDDALESIASVDVLVNAAGILRRSTVEDHSLDDWNDTLAVNLRAPHDLSQHFVRGRLAADAPGCIVNVCSIESFTAARQHIAYTVSKSALLMLTKAMARELADRGIRVNAIAPGVTETGMNAGLRQDAAKSEALLRSVPMARFGRPDEQAAVIAFLASDDASYMTGSILPVDGGFLTQ